MSGLFAWKRGPVARGGFAVRVPIAKIQADLKFEPKVAGRESGMSEQAATGSSPTGSTGGAATGGAPVGAAPAAPAAAAPAPVAATVPTVKYDDFAKLDLRVARVLEAREHPNASKLLLLKIRVGSVEKQIVAGIKGHYEPAKLVGTQIVVVNNLEPAMIRGEESNGMLLAGSDDSGVVLVRPERELAEGSKVK